MKKNQQNPPQNVEQSPPYIGNTKLPHMWAHDKPHVSTWAFAETSHCSPLLAVSMAEPAHVNNIEMYPIESAFQWIKNQLNWICIAAFMIKTLINAHVWAGCTWHSVFLIFDHPNLRILQSAKQIKHRKLSQLSNKKKCTSIGGL